MGPSSTDFSIEKLAPGIHAAIARSGGYALSNSTIVDLGEATVVFDSMLTPRAGAALARTARRLTGRAPDFVVNSHYHHDHVWGNGAVHPGHVIATPRTRELLARKGRQQFLSIRTEAAQELRILDAPKSPIPLKERPFFRGWFEGVAAMPPSFSVRIPDLTVRSEMTLHGSWHTLRLITNGGGHSPSDLYGFVEDERIALLGDLVVTKMHPSVGDGYPRAWDRILGEVRRLNPKRVVPGHGAVGGVRAVTAIQLYLRDLQRLVRRARTHRERLHAISVPERYRAWQGTPFFESNLARVRQEQLGRLRPPS